MSYFTQIISRNTAHRSTGFVPPTPVADADPFESAPSATTELNMPELSPYVDENRVSLSVIQLNELSLSSDSGKLPSPSGLPIMPMTQTIIQRNAFAKANAATGQPLEPTGNRPSSDLSNLPPSLLLDDGDAGTTPPGNEIEVTQMRGRKISTPLQPPLVTVGHIAVDTGINVDDQEHKSFPSLYPQRDSLALQILQPQQNNIPDSPLARKDNPSPKLVIGKLTVQIIQEEKNHPLVKQAKPAVAKTSFPAKRSILGYGLGQL